MPRGHCVPRGVSEAQTSGAPTPRRAPLSGGSCSRECLWQSTTEMPKEEETNPKSQPTEGPPRLQRRWTSGSHRKSSTAQLVFPRHRRRQRQDLLLPWASRRQQQGHRAGALPHTAPALCPPRWQPMSSAGSGQGQRRQRRRPRRGPWPRRRERGSSAVPESCSTGKTTLHKSFLRGSSVDKQSSSQARTAVTKGHHTRAGNASPSTQSGSTPSTQSSCRKPTRLPRSRQRQQLLLTWVGRCQQQGHRARSLPGTAPTASPVPRPPCCRPRPSASSRVPTCCSPPTPGGLCRLSAACSGAPVRQNSHRISAHCQSRIQVSSFVVYKYFYFCKDLWKVVIVLRYHAETQNNQWLSPGR
ncbi:uncharacterized protein LOC113971395 isoform X1 [Neopelma chrysocephalum]|uniref:uncharacterized protein LOC113971395 isoform X1 n=1 Tax=Neopelma chrysocephalum TaxID=114329 RepID=UPI000FCD0EC9|nr:uncharacterized protein LOC113971395 isoform X1 [Neopelma chrysocephalum]